MREEVSKGKSRIAELGKMIAAFAIESEDNDKKYNEAVTNARIDAATAKESLMAERQEALLKHAQYKATTEAVAKAKYDAAISELSGKQSSLQEMSHERDMKKERAKTETASKKTVVAESAGAKLQQKRSEIDAAKSDKLADITKRSIEITELRSKRAGFDTEIAVINSTNDSKRAQITLYTKELEEIEQKMKDNMSVKSLEQLMSKLNEQMIGLVAEEVEHNSKIKLCIATQELLTEDGIKKKFMAMVLPVMNATIRRIIDEFQYKYNFHFDENFDAVIERMGRRVSPEALSTGEEKMIDLIVVLAVMELIKMKHPKINVMFLDEVFASLDQNNIERTIKILREFMDKYNMTLFAISHTTMPKQYFDHIISVSNDGMFSDMKID
jgi:DNA repair exonuclease SbcCD ATPase subunit